MIIAMSYSPALHTEVALVCNDTVGCKITIASGGDRPSKDQANDRKKNDLVITPGGPRPREQVHPVGPEEVVRRNPDGTYTVVPNSVHDDNKESPSKK